MPDRALLPIGRESQSVGADLRMLGQQPRQPGAPMGVGRHDLQQHFDHHGLCVEAPRVGQVSGVLLGDNRLDRVGAIPEALMMRGEIAQIGDRVQPRSEDRAVEAEGLGNRLLVLAQQVFEHLRDGAEGQHFEDHPGRWQRRITVLVVVVLDESLAHGRLGGIVADVLLEHFQKLVVAICRHEQAGIRVPVRAVALAHGLRQHGAERDFDPLQGIHYRQPQLTVEDVEIENVIEAHAAEKPMRAIGVVVDLEWQRVAGEAVIADEAQVVLRAGLVGNEQPPATQERNLCIGVDGGLVEFHRQ